MDIEQLTYQAGHFYALFGLELDLILLKRDRTRRRALSSQTAFMFACRLPQVCVRRPQICLVNV